MQSVRELGKRLSNWGRWGAEDERGTLNFITPRVVKRAASLVRRGQVFSLGLSFGAEGPQIGQGGRVNPLHLMTAVDQKLPAEYPDAFRYADDVMVFPLQCATQWDSLAHVHYDGQLYNGFPAATTSSAGAARNGIDKVGAGDRVARRAARPRARRRRAAAARPAAPSRRPTSTPPSARRACASSAATSCSCAPATSASSRPTATGSATCA